MKIVWSNGAKKALTKIDGRYHRRIVITLRGDPNNDCYVLAVKLRTSTTYLHEENTPYGCSAN